MKFLFSTFFSIAVLLSTQALVAQPTSKDLDALAHKLVTLCVDIKEGENVLVIGSVRDIELLENIAVHVRKVGAFPIISVGSDRLTRRMFVDVPEKFDAQKPELDAKLADIFNSIISVETGEVEGLLADISPERFAIRAKAYEEITKLFQDRKVRSVNLGNGLYPTETLAKRFKVSKKDLADIFWKGVNVDFKSLQTTGEAVRKSLENGKQIRITTSAGTDLTFEIQGRPINISDGVISEEDMNRGPGNYDVWLPAGEVYLTPITGTAEGKVVVEKHFSEGKVIEGLTLTFKAGKVVSITAKSGLERLKKVYDAANAGKEDFAFIDFGINSNVKIPSGSEMVAWMPAGMVTVGIGDNIWLGGENSVGYSLTLFLTGATVTVDGVAIITNGVLKL
jgi:leucyl aminopeptidase (aminopeptidase T)